MAVEKVLVLRAKAIKEVRKLGEVMEEDREMLLVKLENEDQKWEVMEKKSKLKDRRKRI